MKKLILLAALALSLTGCENGTEFGECVGLSDSQRDPGLVYEVSTRNAIVSIIFFETLVVPVVWALEHAYCPVGTK